MFLQVAAEHYRKEATKSIKPLDSYNRDYKCEFCKHSLYLIGKRLRIYSRSVKALLLELFIPVLLIIVGFSLSKLNFFYDSSSRELSTSIFDKRQRILVNKDIVQTTEGDSLLTPQQFVDSLPGGDFFEPIYEDYSEEFEDIGWRGRDVYKGL